MSVECLSSFVQRGIQDYVYNTGWTEQPLTCTVFSLYLTSLGLLPMHVQDMHWTWRIVGRRAHGFIIKSSDKKLNLPLPTLLECNQVTNNHSEIPIPDAARYHLKRMAEQIPSLNPNTNILVLLGRDILRVHKVSEQISAPGNAHFAHRSEVGGH